MWSLKVRFSKGEGGKTSLHVKVETSKEVS